MSFFRRETSGESDPARVAGWRAMLNPEGRALVPHDALAGAGILFNMEADGKPVVGEIEDAASARKAVAFIFTHSEPSDQEGRTRIWSQYRSWRKKRVLLSELSDPEPSWSFMFGLNWPIPRGETTEYVLESLNTYPDGVVTLGINTTNTNRRGKKTSSNREQWEMQPGGTIFWEAETYHDRYKTVKPTYNVDRFYGSLRDRVQEIVAPLPLIPVRRPLLERLYRT